MNIFETVNALAEGMNDELVTLRRDFHKYAESGWFEMRTSSLVARYLTDLGYEVLVGEDVCDRETRMGVPSEEALEKAYQRAIEQGGDPEFLPATRGGMTGVIGILRCGEGPTLAMRFDIDALGVIESEEADHVPCQLGFASVNHGSMHACGHDAHTTFGLGVAKVLMQIKDQLHGTVKLIFQPAEEGVRGAKSIVAKGHLDGVQYFLGSHVTKRVAGKENVDVIPGASGTLATCKYDVVYHGKNAHAGGVPHMGCNALQAAAAAVMQLYGIPRHGGGASRINVGTLHAGTGRNVIADIAKMEIEVRGANTEINNYMCEFAEKILRNTAETYGCTCEIKLMGAADSLSSDRDFADQLQALYRDQVGLRVWEKSIMPTGGSEDLSYMMNRVQEQGGKATFLRIMCEMPGPAHNRRFDISEDCLVNAVKAFCGAAAELLK